MNADLRPTPSLWYRRWLTQLTACAEFPARGNRPLRKRCRQVDVKLEYEEREEDER